MNTARYVVALIAVMSYIPAVGWWYLIHPLVGFWRRLGRPLFYTIMTVTSLAFMGAVYLIREPLLAVEYGTNPALWPLVILFYGASIAIEVRCRKYLKPKILLGVPELAPGSGGGKLITEGIYSRVRHPRYLAVFLGTVAVAFFTNYLAVYVIAALVAPALYLVVVLEEKELRDRFGQPYEEYCRRVPRFIPRRRPAVEAPAG
jgi:protein-S-isoprenylcysteine O-methyltransferase Ste14